MTDARDGQGSTARETILYLITRAERGGAQMHVLDLMRFSRSRYDVHLACGEDDFLTAEARRLGITVHILPNLVQPLSPVRDMRAVAEIRQLIREVRPSLVHAHSSKAGLVGRIAARLERVRVVFTVHGWAFTGGASWKRKLVAIPSEWLVGRLRGQQVITVSNYDRRLALRYGVMSRRRLVTVHNGLADSGRMADPGAAELPHIVMVARFAPPKDFSTLLKALSTLDVPFRASLVGGGPLLDECRAECTALGLDDRVTFLGERNDIPEILSNAHVFVLSSRFEALPISILEAMRSGLPVIASNVGGVPELVADGQSGYLVPPSDFVALRDRLTRLLLDRAARAAMGEQSRARFVANFSYEQMLRKTVQVYQQQA